MMSASKIIGLIAWVCICFGAALIGSRFTPGEWYAYLRKPAWTPPGYVFGPVWALLYTTMGVAAWLVWKRAGFSGARLALSLFVTQLTLNAMWSWIFFGMQKPGLAVAEILLLWVAVLLTLITFWHKCIPAGVLMLPYLVWVSFAAVLNFSIWWLSKSQ